ncbi:MAG: pilus assembly protein [Oligoflexia bacterium]|nr:pilus assembly protein [Oligoflexia bacterium]
MNRIFNRARSALSVRGTVLVELALVIPLAFSMIFGCLELSKMFRSQEILSAVTREGANAGFRECGQENNPEATCLPTVHDRIVTYSNSVLPGVETVISVYKYVPAGPNPLVDPESAQLVGIIGVNRETGKTAGGYSSHYVPGPLDPDAPDPETDMYRKVPLAAFPLNSLHDKNERIVISEVFYRYQPPVNSPALPFFRFLSKQLYEVTIF